ncbi:MAG: hypothetical protein EOP04_05180 [Proteobacteria bacterium]|nr:MAG: hypothetical protein EOP04_05180 [Pseudomonadota bacterium]
MKIVKFISTEEMHAFPLLYTRGEYGVLQSHLVRLLNLNSHALSILIKGMNVKFESLSREEAQVLKDQGIINQHTRGGHFLPLKSIISLLDVIQSEKSGLIRAQLP